MQKKEVCGAVGMCVYLCSRFYVIDVFVQREMFVYIYCVGDLIFSCSGTCMYVYIYSRLCGGDMLVDTLGVPRPPADLHQIQQFDANLTEALGMGYFFDHSTSIRCPSTHPAILHLLTTMA